MKETIHQNLVEIGLRQLLGQLFAVDLRSDDRIQRRHLPAPHEIHRQDTRRRVVFDRLRNIDQLVFTQISPEGHQVLRLQTVIELAYKRLLELLEHQGEPVLSSGIRVFIQKFREFLERFEVVEYLIADIGPLNLDRHVPAVPKHGVVYLP